MAELLLLLAAGSDPILVHSHQALNLGSLLWAPF